MMQVRSGLMFIVNNHTWNWSTAASIAFCDMIFSLRCSYMIDKLEIAPESAISAYNVARGHSIERQNYLDDLHGKRAQWVVDSYTLC